MNGTFFILNTTTSAITSMNGKYLSHYNDSYVLSKEPEMASKYNDTTGNGNADEWEVLFDLKTKSWLPVPSKQLSGTINGAKIVDVNVIGPFVDYMIQYKTNQNIVIDGKTVIKYLYYRDRNVDGVFTTADYTVINNQVWDHCIIGPYDEEQKYLKSFNNSVMLYPNIRMVLLGNTIVTYGYTVAPSRIGTILIPFGDLQDDFIPNFYIDNQKQFLISKTSNGYVKVIRLGTNIPHRIERMAQYIHKINTIDVINILVEREKRITAEPGSLDWNNKLEIKNGITSTISQDETTYHVNSAYNPLYEITGLRSSSMIVSNTIFILYGKLYNQPTANGYNLEFINANLMDYGIDVFIDTVSPAKYRFSLLNSNQKFNGLFEDLNFPDGVIVPFPIGTSWSMQNEVVAVGGMSQGLMAGGLTNDNKTMEIYLFSNQIYYGHVAFDLFGIQYVFDGDYIYQNSERIAMAFGYMFIGCDNNSAYFYNKWDKSIYQFTGSRNLIKMLNMSNRTQVKIGRFDGFSGEMILLTEDEILKQREGVIMNFPYVPGNLITSTKQGPYIELENGIRQLLSPLDGNLDTFEIVIGFIGVDSSTVCNYERIDISLKSHDKKQLDFTVEMQTINQDTKESQQKQIHLNSNDWSLDGSKTIQLKPQYVKGTGLSLRIYSENEINIDGIDYTYEPIARTANSQRSGH